MVQVLDAVDKFHFGASLQSPDLTAVWGFRTLLDRDFTSVGEYHDAVMSLPELVLGGMCTTLSVTCCMQYFESVNLDIESSGPKQF